MADMLKIAMIFTGVNRMGGVLNSINSSLDKVSKKVEKINKIGGMGKKLFAAGSGVLGAAAVGIGAVMKPYADLEQARLDLQNTLMVADGNIDRNFGKISKVAVEMGNLLPGTTADFYGMATAMKRAGSSVETIANGGLEAAAKMAAVLKLDYGEAGEAIGKFQQALGIADGDLVKFADTIQRTVNLGVNMGEMQYAFSKMAGPLKILGLQGLTVANNLAPVVAMLIRTGRSGEEVGTAMGNIFSVGLTKGLYTNTEGMLKFMDTLGKMDKQARMVKIEKLFGKGGPADVAGILSAEGLAGYKKISAEMAHQADLNKRAKASLGGMKAMMEALGGTVENVGAALGESFAPEIKQLTGWLTDVASKVQDWAAKNSTLVRTITGGVLSVGAFMVVTGGLMMAWGAGVTVIGRVVVVFNFMKNAINNVRAAVTLARTVMMMFGITSKIAVASTGIGLLIVAAVLIYEHWDKIKSFFIDLWPSVKPYIQPLLDFFTKLWQTISDVASGMGRALGIGGKMPAAVPVRSLPPGASGRGGGSTTVNYSPTINAPGANGLDIRKALDNHANYIANLVQQQNQRQARRAY